MNYTQIYESLEGKKIILYIVNNVFYWFSNKIITR